MGEGDRFSRSEALLGEAAMARLASARVLVVGVGGVGSWCAEALVRTGLGHIALMDDDVVAESNANRQCPATARTVGRPKVEAMAERLREISPACEIVALNERWPADLPNDQATQTVKRFSLVVDAIDSVDCKAALILAATEAGVPLVSSMGAARRLDPTKVRVTRFEKVEGDGLARALRQRFRRTRRFPAAKFSCAWSTEVSVGRSVPDRRGAQGTTRPTEEGTKGSLMQVTAVFGMCLASEAIKILTKGETK